MKIPKICGYCGVNWLGCPIDRRFTTRYCVSFGGKIVSWKSKKQSVVARSSAEAEYKAMAPFTCELVWIKQLLQELKFWDVQQMKLYCDNQATLHIASNLVFHERTKHIEIDCHFVGEKLQSYFVLSVHFSYIYIYIYISQVVGEAPFLCIFFHTSNISSMYK